MPEKAEQRRAEWLVTTDWLAERLEAPDIVVLDGTWHLPPTGRDGRAEYEEAHIPGAHFFDIDLIADTESGLPHTLPSPEKFASTMRRMGIGDGSRIVVYDQLGLFSAARVWWMFRVFGHKDVVLLDGGLPKWMAEERNVSDEPPAPRERHFTARRHAGKLISADSVQSGLEAGNLQVIDARPADRFAGEAPEPRPGVRPGHAPGAINVPFPTLLNDDGTLKSVDDLRAVFAAAGVKLDQPAATMCGSGVTAALAALALEILGHKNIRLYDGSWADWGADESRPVVTGA
jgi:thiosulfate/3-mercaptopyruvate sulfurtransferase